MVKIDVNHSQKYATRSMSLELRAVTKRFEGSVGVVQALKNINLRVNTGEFVSIVGQSGCGKSSLINILGGLTRASSGEVFVHGLPLWLGSDLNRQLKYDIGVVFQQPNLFPWYTVVDNISLPLKLLGISKSEREGKAREFLDLLRMSDFGRCYPAELSGGMQQRVALARALILRPKILLLDEPFGALDALTRDRMNLELQDVTESTRCTTVLVTHSIREAIFLSDRIFVLTERPGTVRTEILVDLPKPRNENTESNSIFLSLAKDIRNSLSQ